MAKKIPLGPHGVRCDLCPLGGSKIVPTPASRKPRFAIIGEAPGLIEEEEGGFFKGPTGYDVRRFVEHNGWTMEDVHRNNVLACRPKTKLAPDEWRKAAECCSPRLKHELDTSGVKFAFLLGGQALRAFRQEKTGAIFDRGGEFFTPPAFPSVRAMASFHPAFCMRDQHAYFPVLWQHFENFDRVLRGGEEDAGAPLLFATSQTPVRTTLDILTALKSPVGFDVENNPETHKLTAIGLADLNSAACVPWPPENYYAKKDAARLRAAVLKILADSATKKIAHNGGHDTTECARDGVELNGYAADTLLLHHVCAPLIRHKLGFATGIEFTSRAWKVDFHEGADEKGSAAFVQGKRETKEEYAARLTEYCALDAWNTRRLYDKLRTRLKDVHRGQEIYDGYFRRNLIAAEMRQAGVRANVPEIERLDKRLRKQIARTRSEFQKIAYGINPSSLDACANLFYTRWHQRARAYTEGGDPRLNEEDLQRIAARGKRVGAAAHRLLQFRKWAKWHSTYIRGLKIEKGLIHATPKVWGTKGSRWSYERPNLQNIPKRLEIPTKQGSRKLAWSLRSILRPRPGHWFVEADYSAVEFRIAAWLSGDKLLCDAFARGDDVHKIVCQQMFGRVTDSLRDITKRLNYGLLYGASADTLYHNLKPDFPKLDRFDVENLHVTWWMHRTAFRTWQDGLLERIRNLEARTGNGYVECPISGRRLYTYKSANPNLVFNFPVQGTAGDLIDHAIEGVHTDLKTKNAGRLIAQVHDAILIECRDPVAGAKILQRHMVQTHDHNGVVMTFPIEFGVSKEDWGKMIKRKNLEEVKHVIR